MSRNVANYSGPSFYPSRFYGSVIYGFTSTVGWGLETGEVSVELVDDDCPAFVYNELGEPTTVSGAGGGGFNPPAVGDTAYFFYNGFAYNGILQGWQQNNSMSGKTYSARVITPHVILSNATLILKGLDDYDPNKAPFNNGKFINIHRLQNPVPFRGMTFFSFCNEVGLTWGDIVKALHMKWIFVHAGVQYRLDLSELDIAGNNNLRFTGESTSVLDAINRFATVTARQVYLALESTGGMNVIKVYTNDTSTASPTAVLMNQSSASIEDRLKFGVAYKFAGLQQRCSGEITADAVGFNDVVQSMQYGVELANPISDVLIHGDYLQIIQEFYHKPKGDAPPCEGITDDGNPNSPYGADTSGTIRHFWGEEPDQQGNMIPITSVGEGDGENFNVDVSQRPFFGILDSQLANSPYYNISVLEIRAAAFSFDSWIEFMAAFKPNILRAFYNVGPGTPLSRFSPDVIWPLIDGPDTADLSNAVNQTEEFMRAYSAFINDNEIGKEALRSLHSFVSSFAANYGKKFFLNIPEDINGVPFIQCCITGAGAARKPNLEKTDSGYAWGNDGSGGIGGPIDNILGYDWNSTVLEVFKSPEGKLFPM